jgi:hypothetical protein
MDQLTAELEEFERSDREAAQGPPGDGSTDGGSHLADAFREESEEVHREEDRETT